MDFIENLSFEELKEYTRGLLDENERLIEENINLKDKYQIDLTVDEMELMYSEYYSEDNETIHN